MSLFLRRRTEHLRRADLLETNRGAVALHAITKAFDKTHRSNPVDVSGILWLIERDGSARLRGEVVDFIGADCFEDLAKRGTVREMPMVQKEPSSGLVRVLVEVVEHHRPDDGIESLLTLPRVVRMDGALRSRLIAE